MACPATLNMTNVTGAYTINKTLSDDPELSMALRGVSWPLRKAMKVAPPFTLTIQHNTAVEPNTWKVSITSVGPMKPIEEVQHFNWEWIERQNPFIGTIKVRSKSIPWEEIQEEYLREGWHEPTVIWTQEVHEKDGWEAFNVWGLVLIDGERRLVRKTWMKTRKSEENQCRIIHDYSRAV